MAGNTIGKNFTVTTWGEPGNEIYGCVIDGCPAGLPLAEQDIRKMLLRRFPDADKIPVNPYGIPLDYGTDAFGAGVPIDPYGNTMEIGDSQDESDSSGISDQVRILSGVFNGLTTGAPISIMIESARKEASDDDANLSSGAFFNGPAFTDSEPEQDADPEDDDDPGFGYDAFSPFVMPGGFGTPGPVKETNPEEYKDIYRPGHADFSYEAKYGSRDWRGGRASGKETVARLAAGAVAEKILETLDIHIETEAGVLALPGAGDTVGGMIECVVTGVPAGIGEPVFDKLDARLAQAVMSIGGIKSVEIGAGSMVSQMTGSFNNDPYIILDGKMQKDGNNAGGIAGGISDGDEIIVKAAMKPAPSIALPQDTVNKDLEETQITLDGRHADDIAEQAGIVMESMIAVTLTDLLFENMHARVESLKDFYNGISK